MTLMSNGDIPCNLARIKLVISPRRICFLKFILEAYDGLAVLSTLDATTGLVQISYYPDLHDDLREIVDSLDL